MRLYIHFVIPHRSASQATVVLLGVWIGVMLPLFTKLSAAERPLLGLTATNEYGWRGVSIANPFDDVFEPQVYRIDGSENLSDWVEVARVHRALWPAYDPVAARQRFYRVVRWPRDGQVDDWRNQILYKSETFDYYSEPFASAQDSALSFIKFAILLSDPTRVYFQDTKKYPLHWEFCVARLPGYVGMSRTAFDQISLYTNGQQVVLGTVLLPVDLVRPTVQTLFDYGIQFVANDPLPPAAIHQWFKLVKSAVASQVKLGAYYVPSPSQSAVATTQAAFFETNGMPLATVAKWLNADTIYSDGWALGRLIYLPHDQISAAYFDGRLGPEDILLTDVVPAELPFLAGILCLNPATPSSHVAILAQAYGVPFAFLGDEPFRSMALALSERRIILIAGAAGVQIINANDMLDPAIEQQVLSYKQVPPASIRPKETIGAFSSQTTNLVPSDIRFYGGKAANFGLLRRVISSNSPVAIAFSMDLWDAFMDQALSSGVTLRNEISNRLAGVSHSHTNLSALRATLDSVRILIRNGAFFNATQQVAILEAIAQFSPTNNIRFRSSSNAEDAEGFTAAGLLDSYSGCVADDTDSDGAGPSRCDPTETNERGVFRAIQRVYASFYNENAYLERVRHEVNEAEVGVGVLVHHSFPDDTETANGVATAEIEIQSSIGRTNVQIKFVSQPGAASVTNPSDDAQAEVARTRVGRNASATTNFTFEGFAAYSSLLPQGVTALTPEDFEMFSRKIFDVAMAYRDLFPGKDRFTLDFEYKKITNSWLVIRQVREIPPPFTTNVAPVLVDEMAEIGTWQGEEASNYDIGRRHELKIRGTFQTRNIQLTESNLAQPFITGFDFEYYSNGVTARFTADAAELTNLLHFVDGNVVTNIIPASATHPEFTFRFVFPSMVSGTDNPFITISRMNVYRDGLDGVRLWQSPHAQSNSSIQIRECEGDLTFSNGTRHVLVRTRYYWPDARTIAANGSTAHLVQFIDTTITGLSATPIMLTNYFSQTYLPSHHNLAEYFAFEPRVEPGLSAEVLSEIEALGMTRLYMTVYRDEFEREIFRCQFESDAIIDD